MDPCGQVLALDDFFQEEEEPQKCLDQPTLKYWEIKWDDIDVDLPQIGLI